MEGLHIVTLVNGLAVRMEGAELRTPQSIR